DSTDRLLGPEVDSDLFVADLTETSAPGGFDASVRHSSNVFILTIRPDALDREIGAEAIVARHACLQDERRPVFVAGQARDTCHATKDLLVHWRIARRSVDGDAE